MKTLGYFTLCLALCFSVYQGVNDIFLSTHLLEISSATEVNDNDIVEKSSIYNSSENWIYACPRCRRAQPPGPRKRNLAQEGAFA